ncbi:MAG: pyruvate carboxylase [Oceanococcaceae bacterium]
MKVHKLLVANRGEIAIRVMRAAAELGIRTVAIYAPEDRFALHRFKADESYSIGDGGSPVGAYLDMNAIIRIARTAGVDAIHPGYGFLSENPDFAQRCADAGIAFIGPSPAVLRTLGDKVSARTAALDAEVPVLPASAALPADPAQAAPLVEKVGYPVMMKASWGGGGRGMRVIRSADELAEQMASARREAAAAFGNDEVYVEKLVERARHVEVQILGDTHGNVVHLFERDCSVQRRNQKVVERAPAPYLTDPQREELCASARRLCASVGYSHAGTVEFLLDVDSGKFYFIEVNPRIQVEHTVTEMVTGVDLIKSQILVTEGGRIGDPAEGRRPALPAQEDLRLNGHALQCRVTTEDPENGFAPDHGRLVAYRSPAGFGIRLDGGTAYSGAVITPHYDSMLVKVTAWAPTTGDAVARMDRALREFRIRGLSTNLQFLENVINHPTFTANEATTRFIDNTPALFVFAPRKDRASRLLRFVGEVCVNGHPEMRGRTLPELPLPEPRMPPIDLEVAPPMGLRDQLKEFGPAAFAQWLRDSSQLRITDTSLRDAHQSLFATRMRTRDMVAIAPHYARLMPELMSLECWGGATFDVAMRFLKECPWERLRQLRAAIPNIPFQMLLRAANAVGYTNYPDNVVRYFVQQAAQEGIDIFRVFDSLNNVDTMRVAMDAVIEAGAVCEGTICYTGDLHDAKRPKFTLDYYVQRAKALEAAGAHIIGIKDMAGVCRPRAARDLVTALKQEVGLPLHFHTHDTSGISAASVLAAVEAGCDAVDGALDSLSGLTSQPNLSSIAAALAGTDRDPGLNPEHLHQMSEYFEDVRRFYAPFEPNIRSGTADVYRHEMPGGQYTNLREQARSLGLESRWTEVSQAYADVNRLFSDIVKVTPSSKVVGDLALFMVSRGLTSEQVADPDVPVDFPASVVELFRGDLGLPPEPWPEQLAAKILRGEPARTERPGATLEPVDLEAARATAAEATERDISDTDLASFLMYPKVFTEFAKHDARYGDVSRLPTSAFFYGLHGPEEELHVDIDQGKTLIIRLRGRGETQGDGLVRLFFELNGQARTIRVAKEGAAATEERPKARAGEAGEIGSPMPGLVTRVNVSAGETVSAGTPLFVLEAMKMETVVAAPCAGTVDKVLVSTGSEVESRELLLRMTPAS